MALGDWLSRQGIPFVIETPGGSGRPIPGLRSVPAPDLDCAYALAEAVATMGPGVATLWDGDVLTFVSRRVDPGEPTVARTLPGLATAVETTRKLGAGSLAVRPAFDLAADAGPANAVAPGFDPSLAARLTGTSWLPGSELVADLVLAGRGVVRAGAVPALQELAARTGLGVLNVFTAKGVFRWDSPFHLGTGCLQERDLALAGAHPDAVVVGVGLDDDECPPALFAAAGLDPARVVTLDPADLPAAAETLRARIPVVAGGERPALYRDLSAVVGPLYAETAGPLNPACAAADLAAVLPAHGSVFSEPGPAAHWLGRTFSTVRLGSVRVPAAGGAGLAIAGAIAAGLTGAGVAVAVVDRVPDDGVAAGCLRWADELGLTVVVEVWGDDGEPLSSAEHRAAVTARLAQGGVGVLELPVDYAALTALVAAAGPVVAWGG
ncbi:thiamine pyrophosphate-binding protein [Frankia sp. AgB1.9]|uniref:thiamine pyrophosphate-binding protein n=1 Tax=Frankia sp. AgB1.9 TaxID=1836968 RepID=UPI001933AF58|nr:thiamine pyrophosphate-binding protein [Frankia sp. AgB1.9]MBL7548065.1 thiamine pyrophosphate-binding protein [Frankia sp. AgB1.9]